MRLDAKVLLVVLCGTLFCIWMLGKVYCGLTAEDIVVIEQVELIEFEDPDWLEFEDNYPAINIVMIVKDLQTLRQSFTLLKSLLYYQGRIAWNTQSCFLTRTPLSDRPMCELIDLEIYESLALHWFVSGDIWNLVIQMFEDWELPGLELNMYELEEYNFFLNELGVDSSEESFEFIKLLLAFILPMDVDKVIVLDSSVLFNNNVGHLWSLFEQFSSDQFIGATCDQSKQCSQTCSAAYGNIYPNQINTGLLLFRLDQLKNTNWFDVLRGTINILTVVNRTVPSAGTILYSMIAQLRGSFFNLPCEWNVQLNSTQQECCPVYWTNRSPNEGECFEEAEGAKLMACAIQFSPELEGQAGSEYESDTLQGHFYQTYSMYDSMPLDCFV